MAALAAFHAPVGAAGPDSLSRLTAEVHFGHAEGDLTPEALGRLNKALDAAEVNYTSEIYPGTVHGFTMSDTGAFDPAAMRQHWDRLLPLSRPHPVGRARMGRSVVLTGALPRPWPRPLSSASSVS